MMTTFVISAHPMFCLLILQSFITENKFQYLWKCAFFYYFKSWKLTSNDPNWPGGTTLAIELRIFEQFAHYFFPILKFHNLTSNDPEWPPVTSNDLDEVGCSVWFPKKRKLRLISNKFCFLLDFLEKGWKKKFFSRFQWSRLARRPRARQGGHFDVSLALIRNTGWKCRGPNEMVLLEL